MNKKILTILSAAIALLLVAGTAVVNMSDYNEKQDKQQSNAETGNPAVERIQEKQTKQSKTAQKAEKSETASKAKQSETNKLQKAKETVKESVATPSGDKVTKEKVEKYNLSLHEADFYKPLGNTGKVVCGLCPHSCVLKEGETGRCRVRANVDGKLRSLVYSRPITMHLDPIEKKPFFHFHPTENTMSIATAGCNLRCRNCQNWHISQLSPFEMEEVKVKSPEEIIKKAKINQAGIISYTYNDPIVFYEYMFDIAKLAHENGIKNTMVTAGHINKKPLKKLCQYMDAVTLDVKGMTNEFYRRFNTGQLDPVLDAIKVIDEEGVWLEVSYLVIPGENDTKEDFKKFSEWVANNVGPGTPVHFLRFFPKFKMKSKPATPVSTLEKAREIAREAGLNHAYLGNVRNSEAENTYCPNCGKKIIDRNGYRVSGLHIDDGKCEYCGTSINGVWK